MCHSIQHLNAWSYRQVMYHDLRPCLWARKWVPDGPDTFICRATPLVINQKTTIRRPGIIPLSYIHISNLGIFYQNSNNRLHSFKIKHSPARWNCLNIEHNGLFIQFLIIRKLSFRALSKIDSIWLKNRVLGTHARSRWKKWWITISIQIRERVKRGEYWNVTAWKRSNNGSTSIVKEES